MEYALITAAAIAALIVGLGLYYWAPFKVKNNGGYSIRCIPKGGEPLNDRVEFYCRSNRRPTPPSRIIFLNDKP